MRIVLSGGGTAGHINPALALAETLHERGCEVLFAGTPDSLEKRLVEQAGIPFTPFEAAGFDRARPSSLISSTSKIAKSTKVAKRWLQETKPKAVVCFGGYVCIPVGRAAKSLGIPLIIHEQNSVMGMANKYLAKDAAAVALTYKSAGDPVKDKSKIVVTGDPVRRSYIDATREEGRAMLGVPESALMLLVFGGSQGARHINTAIIGLKERLLAIEGLHIVHLTGPKELERVTKSLALSTEEQKRWHLLGYQDRMGETLAAADFVLSRTGATSLAEISARRIPALLVPFPFATDDHQTTNAKEYVDQGAAYMVKDDELESSAFSDALFSIAENAELRESMREAAESFKTEDAADRLADVVMAKAQ